MPDEKEEEKKREKSNRKERERERQEEEQEDVEALRADNHAKTKWTRRLKNGLRGGCHAAQPVEAEKKGKEKRIDIPR